MADMQLLVSPRIRIALGFNCKIVLSIFEITLPIVSAEELPADSRKISGFLNFSCLKKISLSS